MSALCKRSEYTAAEHCWHATAWSYMAHPPQSQQRCCHCGSVRSVLTLTALDTPGHGPFAPSFYSTGGDIPLLGERVEESK